MLRRLTQREQIEGLLDQYSASIKAAFIAAIDEITSSIVVAKVIEMLEAHDTYGAIDALHIEPAAFREFTDQLISAFKAGGDQALAGLPSFGVQRSPWFDYHAPAVAALIAAQAANVVANIIADARAGIGAQIGLMLTTGLPAATIAQRVVGPMSRVTRERTGGLIGLTAQQMSSAAAARAELQSGDPKQIASYFNRKLRDGRFDARVRAAAEAGRPVLSEDVSRLVTLYQQNMRKQRADIFGKSQALQSINTGVATAIRQTMQREGVAPDRLTKTWHTRRDDRVRHTHRTLEGNQIAFDHAFQSDSGSVLRFPGDPLAPPYETINCRCYLSFSLARD